MTNSVNGTTMRYIIYVYGLQMISTKYSSLNVKGVLQPEIPEFYNFNIKIFI